MFENSIDRNFIIKLTFWHPNTTPFHFMKLIHAMSILIIYYQEKCPYLVSFESTEKGKWMDCKRDWKTSHNKKVNFEVIK